MPALLLLQCLAILASLWVAALLWAERRRGRPDQEELLKAKDRTILALTEEVQALRDLAPIKIRDYLARTQDQLRAYCQAIDAGYRSARKDIERCNAEITRRQDQGEWRADEIDQLVQRRQALLQATRTMQPALRELRHQCEFPEPFRLRIARVDPSSVQALTQAYLDLAGLGLHPADQLKVLSERVIQANQYRLDEATLFSSSLFLGPVPPERQGEVWQRPDNGE